MPSVPIVGPERLTPEQAEREIIEAMKRYTRAYAMAVMKRFGTAAGPALMEATFDAGPELDAMWRRVGEVVRSAAPATKAAEREER
jgi:hypothetical protein